MSVLIDHHQPSHPQIPTLNHAHNRRTHLGRLPSQDRVPTLSASTSASASSASAAKLSPIILNRNLHVPPSAMGGTVDRANRKRRSSSIVYHEPPESFEQLSDQAALPNLNAEWVNAKGESWACQIYIPTQDKRRQAYRTGGKFMAYSIMHMRRKKEHRLTSTAIIHRRLAHPPNPHLLPQDPLRHCPRHHPRS